MVTGKLPVGCCHWRKGQRHSYSVLTNHCSWRLLSAGFCSRSPISLHALNVCQEHFPLLAKVGKWEARQEMGAFATCQDDWYCPARGSGQWLLHSRQRRASDICDTERAGSLWKWASFFLNKRGGDCRSVARTLLLCPCFSCFCCKTFITGGQLCKSVLAHPLASGSWPLTRPGGGHGHLWADPWQTGWDWTRF